MNKKAKKNFEFVLLSNKISTSERSAALKIAK